MTMTSATSPASATTGIIWHKPTQYEEKYRHTDTKIPRTRWSAREYVAAVIYGQSLIRRIFGATRFAMRLFHQQQAW
jgi:hypothetical protein